MIDIINDARNLPSHHSAYSLVAGDLPLPILHISPPKLSQTISVRLRFKRSWTCRIWIAGNIMKLAALVAGCRIAITTEPAQVSAASADSDCRRAWVVITLADRDGGPQLGC